MYENLDLSTQTLHMENSELSSLQNVIAYIEEHYSEHIVLADNAFSNTYRKSRCICF